MLGEQIAELKGKMTGQRVLDSEGAMEISVSFTASIRGTPVKYTLTSVGRPSSMGVIQAEGKGVIMGGDSELATFRVGEFGRINPAGGIKFRGAHFYRTSSNGKLASLNNVIGVFEGEIDAEGNAAAKIWEWK
jgi:hypothetical protein